MRSLTVGMGLATLGGGIAVLTALLVQQGRRPQALPPLTARVPAVPGEAAVDSAWGELPRRWRDLVPAARGAHVVRGPTLVGVGLDSAMAQVAAGLAVRTGYRWIARPGGGVHLYDPVTRLELRLARRLLPQGYVLIAPGQLPIVVPGARDEADLGERLAAYRRAWGRTGVAA